jgi:mRNA-degrading endonuclease YafQ of YafQ-DinJ toxin-antitoxin module
MKRDVKRMNKRGKDMSKLIAALDLLASITGTHSDSFDG